MSASRKFKSCADCRKQKTKCVMRQKGPPCQRCARLKLSCVLEDRPLTTTETQAARVRLKAPLKDDVDYEERGSLSDATGFQTITRFSWFDITHRLQDLCDTDFPKKAAKVHEMNLVTMSLNNYTCSARIPYQFRWKLYEGRPEVYHPEIFMAKATWTDRTISDWDGHTPMRRQFASSLENAGWASEWNEGRILRIQWSHPSKRGGVAAKYGKNMGNTHTNIELGRAHGTVTLHVVRPREQFESHEARAKIPLRQACDDAASLFNALRMIYEEGGGAWEAKNLASWNDVRDEVVARAIGELFQADVALTEASVASEGTARMERLTEDVSGDVDDVR